MFEKMIDPAPSEANANGALRPLDWHELSARLGAMRDLRAIAAASAQRGSFGPGATGKSGVNHDGLATRSMTCGTAIATPHCGNTGHRGTQ